MVSDSEQENRSKTGVFMLETDLDWALRFIRVIMEGRREAAEPMTES